MKTRYIGSFPPPYGGVTIKNKLLFSEISKRIPVIHIRNKKNIPAKLFQLVNLGMALLPGQQLIIGVSAAGGTSLLLTRLLYRLAPSNMRKSIYFMMGGTEAGRIAKKPNEVAMYRQYKAIFVEVLSMKERLIQAGLDNVYLYPNCRKRPEKEFKPLMADSEKLRCVFFSLIQPMKGCDLLLEAAEQLPEIDFYFYGHIDSEYKEKFLIEKDRLSNVYYEGIFSGSDQETYAELRKYDVLLFPSRYKTEGVPGIIVEAKIAGLPVIASDVSYNRELIKQNVDGLILKENTSQEIRNALSELNRDRKLIRALSKGALAEAEHWYVENYIDYICSEMQSTWNMR